MSTTPQIGNNLLQQLILIPEVLFLVEQISSTRSQVDDLRTPIPIFLQSCTLEAVKGIADPLAAADDALVLVVAERAFIAYAREGGRTDIGIADGAFAVAFVAQAAQ